MNEAARAFLGLTVLIVLFVIGLVLVAQVVIESRQSQPPFPHVEPVLECFKFEDGWELVSRDSNGGHRDPAITYICEKYDEQGIYKECVPIVVECK